MSQEQKLENNKLSSEQNLVEFKWSQNKALNRIERFFQFDKFQTTIKKEILGGVSTFLAMAYMLSLIPDKLHTIGSLNHHASLGIFGLFLAVVIVSFVSTFMMGLFANVPIALAPGLGLLAMFITTAATKISGNTILGYEGALIATFFSAIFYTIFSLTPLRVIVIRAIPHSLNVGIGVGIGLFLAYIGISDMGWIQFTTDSHLPVASMSQLVKTYPTILLGALVLILIIFLNFKKIPGAILIALLFGFMVAVIVANVWPNLAVSKTGGAFGNANFRENGGWTYHFEEFSLNINHTWKEFTNPLIWKSPTFYIAIFLFIFLNFFDTTGTLSTCNLLINQKTKLNQEISQKAMAIDSASSILGSAVGLSAVTSCLESSAGIEQGARTGFASIISSFGFLLAIAFFPIFKAIPSAATGAAMTFVGIMVFQNIAEIDWKKPEFLIPIFLMMIFMVITYSIVNGIVIGILAYVLTMLGSGKYKQVHPSLWILTILFILYFVGYAFMQIN